MEARREVDDDGPEEIIAFLNSPPTGDSRNVDIRSG